MKVNCRLQGYHQSLRWGALLPLLLVGVASMQPASVMAQSYAPQHGKAVLHDDGTRTESVKDMNKHEIVETTFDPRGVAITKKTFQVNRNGDPIQGLIHDGAGNMVAKVLFGFDDLGRLMEERCVNTRGEVFRRVIHSYDPSGKRLKPKAFDYKVNAPNMKVAPIDFTKRRAPTDLRPRDENQQIQPRMVGGDGTSVGGGTGTAVQAPGSQPQIMSVSPSGYSQQVNPNGQMSSQQDAYRQAYEQQQAQQAQQQQQAQQPQKEKKKGFWPFGKKEK